MMKYDYTTYTHYHHKYRLRYSVLFFSLLSVLFSLFSSLFSSVLFFSVLFSLFSSLLLFSHLAVSGRSDEKDDEAYSHGKEGDDEGGEEPILDGDEGT